MPTNLDLIFNKEENKPYLAQILATYCIDAKEHAINFNMWTYPCETCPFNNGNCTPRHTECDEAIQEWLMKEVEENA